MDYEITSVASMMIGDPILRFGTVLYIAGGITFAIASAMRVYEEKKRATRAYSSSPTGNPKTEKSLYSASEAAKKASANDYLDRITSVILIDIQMIAAKSGRKLTVNFLYRKNVFPPTPLDGPSYDVKMHEYFRSPGDGIPEISGRLRDLGYRVATPDEHKILVEW